MEFLYSLNRLNVASSRAKCIFVLIACPMVFEADCRTPEQMRLANAYCRSWSRFAKYECIFPVGRGKVDDQRSFVACHFIFRISIVRIRPKVSVGGASGGTVEVETLRCGGTQTCSFRRAKAAKANSSFEISTDGRGRTLLNP